ncbi:MAG: SdpI family protein [Anaerolineales bacterium]|jgi:hypothetical protein
MSTVLIVYLAVGLVTLGLSIPLILGKIPPGAWVGLQVKRIRKNQDIWYRASAYAGKWLLGTGLWVIFAAFALKAIRHISLIAYALGVLAVLVLMLGVGTNQLMRYTKTL